MTIVIHNAVIATVDDKDSLHYGAAIAIDGDRITAIGPSAEILARYPGAEKVDGTGRMVMPGFANVHTHFTMTWRAAYSRTSRRRTSRPSPAGCRPSRSRT